MYDFIFSVKFEYTSSFHIQIDLLNTMLKYAFA